MIKPNVKTDLIHAFLKDEEAKGSTLKDEELLHLILQRTVSKDANRVQGQRLTFGQKMADNIAKFAGSWTFIFVFASCLIFWIFLNTVMLLHPYDAYPFILLNLILSCIAAIQAPVIMMSQNRQEEKDRIRSQNDYKVNLKSEIIIEDLHRKLDRLIANQEKLMQELEQKKNPPDDLPPA